MPFGFGETDGHRDEPVAPETDPAPGWDAIDTALARLFAGQEPFHWGADRLPDHEGLYGLSAYRQGDHWFFITYGLTELFDKVSDDPEVSGFGFELTMRATGADEPSAWPREMLDRLCSYVFASGNAFEPGDRLENPSAITGGDPPSRLTCLAFAADPQLEAIQTANGKVAFTTVVGITPAELMQMKATSTAAVLEPMRAANPLLVTDPHR